MKNHYDIGVVGCWYWGNYGSILNGYATYRILTSLGKDVLNIVTPGNGFEPHARRFFNIAYPKEAISDFLNFGELHELNSICDAFMSGSDQIWNDTSTLQYNKFFRLDFVNPDKKKISFSTSFGRTETILDPIERAEYSRLMQSYDAISVREDVGVRICRDVFGVSATQIMEPVLDLDVEEWSQIANKSELDVGNEPFLLSYILDPTPEKAAAIKYYSEKLGVRFLNVLDGFSKTHDSNKVKLNLPNTLPNIASHDLLKLFSRARFVITDSFHGTAFAIEFNKPFLSLANASRGTSRFQTLLGKLGLMDRLVDDKDIPKDERYLFHIDYNAINKAIAIERSRAIDWLKSALSGEKRSAALPKNVISRLDLELCVACGSCVSSCPSNALSFQQNEYGYYKPTLDSSKCIDCGFCIKKCPAMELPYNYNTRNPPSYAFVCSDKTVLLDSSSGGAFTTLARQCIRQNGVVCAAAWDGLTKVRHLFVDKEEDLAVLRRSKYMQSYLGSLFKDLKQRLESGQSVLFVACPCHVAGLLKYLCGSHKNLLTIDIFCAACPSPLFFEKYVAECVGLDGLDQFQFRAKKESDSVWGPHYYEVTRGGKKEIMSVGDDDYYHHLLTMAPNHCRRCKYQGTLRYGDLTIGDCWGVQHYDHNIDPSHGVSAILVNNEKGREYLQGVPTEDISVLRRESINNIKRYNVCAFQENRNWPVNVKRNQFYTKITSHGYCESIRGALK